VTASTSTTLFAWTSLIALVALRVLDLLPATQFAASFVSLAGLVLAGKPLADAGAKAAEGYAAVAVFKAGQAMKEAKP
jgi:hypothetical protein